jgi:hypothetical protein
MHKTLLALGFVAGLGLAFSQGANAAPANASALKQAAATTATIQQAQYDEHRTRHGMVKCYRDFVVGPYRCHHYRNPV